MSGYVDPTEQLVTEIVVRDMQRDGDFVELTWENHRLFLAVLSAFHDVPQIELSVPPRFPRVNVRVMVPDVDHYWKLANEIGAQIVVPIADRYYGLRDFIIADPDGFGVRFASMLQRR